MDFKTVMVKWLDNKPLQLGTTYIELKLISTKCKRYCKENKKCIYIQRLNITMVCVYFLSNLDIYIDKRHLYRRDYEIFKNDGKQLNLNHFPLNVARKLNSYFVEPTNRRCTEIPNPSNDIKIQSSSASKSDH